MARKKDADAYFNQSPDDTNYTSQPLTKNQNSSKNLSKSPSTRNTSGGTKPKKGEKGKAEKKPQVKIAAAREQAAKSQTEKKPKPLPKIQKNNKTTEKSEN